MTNSHSSGIAYLDQALVSVTNFVIGLILARLLGLEGFGFYAILFVCLIFLSTIHYALFSAPMMTLLQGMKDAQERNSYLRTLHLVQLLGAVGISIVTYLVSFALSFVWPVLESVAFVFSSAVAMLLVQEWMRRYYFASGQTLEALVVDGLKLVLILVGIGWLAWTESLSVASVYALLALSSGALYFAALMRHRLGEIPDLSKMRQVASLNWTHARHLLPSYTLEWVVLQGFILFVGFKLGTQAAGAIRAAQNIVGPLNIVYQAADNIFPVQGARHYRASGLDGVKAYFSNVASWGFAVLGLSCLILAAYAEPLMSLAYGVEYIAYADLLVLQLVSLLLGFGLKLLTAILRSLGKTEGVYLSSLVSTVSICLVIWPMTVWLQASGAMSAKILAEAIAVALCIAYVSKALYPNNVALGKKR